MCYIQSAAEETLLSKQSCRVWDSFPWLHSVWKAFTAIFFGWVQ